MQGEAVGKAAKLEWAGHKLRKIMPSSSLRWFCSQQQQDLLIFMKLFRWPQPRCGGTFVDVGALDGVAMSNSAFFVRQLGWRSLNVEASPESFALLQRNRDGPRDINVHAAVDVATGWRSFVSVGNNSRSKGEVGHSHVLGTSGLDSARRHGAGGGLAAGGGHRGGRSGGGQHGGDGARGVVQVPARPLQSLLDAHGIRRVDVLSIDVEGMELQVLQSVDFGRTEVCLMTLEFNHMSARDLQRASELLERHGFSLVVKLGIDLMYASRECAAPTVARALRHRKGRAPRAQRRGAGTRAQECGVQAVNNRNYAMQCYAGFFCRRSVYLESEQGLM